MSETTPSAAPVDATATGIRFPEIEVQLTGEDGNAFAILGRVQNALRRAGHKEAASEFYAEATSGDYGNLLRTAAAYVTVL